MLCNQCGKNNPFGVNECTYCGARMPAREACGGFADILTYQPPQGQQPVPDAQQPVQFSQQAPPPGAAASGYRADYGRENPFRRQLVKQRKISNILLIVSLILVVAACFCAIRLGKTKANLSDTQKALSEQQEINTQLREQLDGMNQQEGAKQDSPNIAAAKAKAEESSKRIAKAVLELLTGKSAKSDNNPNDKVMGLGSESDVTPTPAAVPTPTPTVAHEPLTETETATDTTEATSNR